VNSALSQVIDEALKRVVPSSEEREHVRAATELARTLVVDEASRTGLNIAVEVGGSVAKDTWLSKDVDIDLFMLFPTNISKKDLGELGLTMAKRAFSGYKQRERYAEHAYLEAWVREVRVNIVPCYRTRQGNWLSAADRSPYHTRYVVEKLRVERLMDDIRLFKKFVKGIGAYGAEIRVSGLSGYLCELLILHYGSFPKALEAISRWRFGEVIDSERLYKGRVEESRRLFSEPLIVIDPVDQNRNVAAAVSRNRMSELIAASRFFLEKPSTSFFTPDGAEESQEDLRKIFSSLEYDVIAVEVRTGGEVPDILWGELLKTQSALKHLLRANDFVVLQSDVWSDEVESSVIIFALETKALSKSKRHPGPPGDTDGVAPFLEKHATDAVAGPWVEEGRWMVGVKRRYVSAETLLRDKLSDGGHGVGVSRGLVEALASSRLLVGPEVLSLYGKEGFARFLTRFLEGRPRWLIRHLSAPSGSSS
jgi:tRNA nucleotidyltransferase (CCA-adding enzyme)